MNSLRCVHAADRCDIRFYLDFYHRLISTRIGECHSQRDSLTIGLFRVQRPGYECVAYSDLDDLSYGWIYDWARVCGREYYQYCLSSSVPVTFCALIYCTSVFCVVLAPLSGGLVVALMLLDCCCKVCCSKYMQTFLVVCCQVRHNIAHGLNFTARCQNHSNLSPWDNRYFS